MYHPNYAVLPKMPRSVEILIEIATGALVVAVAAHVGLTIPHFEKTAHSLVVIAILASVVALPLLVGACLLMWHLDFQHKNKLLFMVAILQAISLAIILFSTYLILA